MSSHFGRLTYDECYINEETKQSIMPGEYKLYYGQNQHDNSCHSLNGPRNDRIGTSSENPENTLGDRAELESILSNRDMPASKCTDGRKLIDKRNKLARQITAANNCDNFLNPDYSRLNNPLDNYRGLSTIDLQLDHPITPAQENVFYGHNLTTLENQNMNSRFGNSTRLESKDDYRKALVSE